MLTDPYFHMIVENVFAIGSQGIVVTGQIESGVINVGNEVYVQGVSGVKTAVITSIEMFRRQHRQAQAGDSVGLRLTGISKEDIQQGDVLQGSV